MCYICLPNKYNCETLLHELNISFHVLYFELDHIFNCLIKLFYFMFDFFFLTVFNLKKKFINPIFHGSFQTFSL